MWPSTFVVLFFLVPVFILVGYTIYLLVILDADDTDKGTLSYVSDLFFHKDRIVEKIVADLRIRIPPFDPTLFDNDPISAQLDQDAHFFALNVYCTNDPDRKMDSVLQACEYANKQVCEAASLKTQDLTKIINKEGVYLNWQEDIGCISSYGNGNVCTTIGCPQKVRPCTEVEYDKIYKISKQNYETYKEEQNLGNSFTIDDYLLSNPIVCRDPPQIDSPECSEQPYVPPKIKCDDDGYCYTEQENDYGKCKIIRQYCESKGESFSSTGLGTCYQGTKEQTAEMIFGQTWIKAYRKAYYNRINACKYDSPGNQTCKQAEVTFELLPFVLFKDAVVAEYTEVAQNIRTNCRINQPDSSTLSKDDRLPPMNGPLCIECVHSFLELWPGYFVTDKINGFVNQLIRLIPGGQDFSGLDLFGLQSVLDFGGKALDAVFKFGADAGKAFQEAGANMSDAYDKLMQGGSLVDFAKDEGAALLKVTGIVLKDCAMLGVNVIKAGFQAYGATLLHGIQAVQIIFNGISVGINALGTLLASKMNKCGAGTSLDECFDERFGIFLGSVFGAAATTFLGLLKGIADFSKWVSKSLKWVATGVEKFFTCFFFFC